MNVWVVAQIFWVFFRISFLSFGGVFGVLPELERMIVTEQGWMTHERFIQSYVMSQFVPGPTMAMCPLVGYWVAGIPGWFAGFFGIYMPPLLIMGVAFATLRRFGHIVWVQHMEQGFRPLVLGLMVASAFRMWWTQSEGVGVQHILAARFTALFLCGGAWALYSRKWVGPLQMIFLFGFLWWGLNRWVL